MNRQTDTHMSRFLYIQYHNKLVDLFMLVLALSNIDQFSTKTIQIYVINVVISSSDS